MASGGNSGSLRPGSRRPPHITVNSGSGGNILDGLPTDSSTNSPVLGTPGLNSQSRSLLPIHHPNAGNYGSGVGASTTDLNEMLLPPGKIRAPRPYQDASSESAMSSRRTSWSSDAGSRDSRAGPFASPFDDSRAPSRNGSDDEVNTQTVAEKYNIMPSAGLLLFPEDVEKDDYLHNPGPEDKEEPKCDIWNKRGMMNLGGLLFLLLAVLALFIAFPVLYDSFLPKIFLRVLT